ncbi:MAG TPA: radical SAM protein [Candidatus Marinimicrobia bacterium]|nr:radical SAM protein [Candidatus Neomarinimicrobiota bacterium]HRS52133.1 radical SAM protein [Candidatus Neomarinimicrobiota bacterium]HRU92490.1 radical SAM protein [Candidatus Neomarinimicrobiota bacterium]
MATFKNYINKIALDKLVTYCIKDPQKHIPKLIDLVEKSAWLPIHKSYVQGAKSIISNPDSNWYQLATRAIRDIDPDIIHKMIRNFFINSGFEGQAKIVEEREMYGFGVPWAVLMDPTSACNLKCKGCWASEYDKSLNLDNGTIDRIIREGKELGIYFYIYSGGEPLIRKNDLIRLAEKHSDCVFLSFTNGTLVDERFADELQRVGNFSLALSIEGDEEATDFRRGKGSYQKLISAMKILKSRGIPFGFSTCYHSQNWNIVAEPEYLDQMIEAGCLFGWYFTYMPLGKHADLSLLARPEHREHMYYRVREARQTKPIFLIDFWNDGEYVNGCIAGGRRYLHINANGDVEPCAFIHYSDTNIKNVSLMEALQSPLFLQYQKHQPFNQNHLRPCPLLDNPDALKSIVLATGAYSTQHIDREDVVELTDKCQAAARAWKPTAERLWEKTLKNRAKKITNFKEHEQEIVNAEAQELM